MNVPAVPEFPKEGETRKEAEPDPAGQEELTATIKRLVGNPSVNQSRRDLLETIEKLQKEVKLRMIKIKKFEGKSDEDQGVLDSGATHAVRPIKCQHGIRSAWDPIDCPIDSDHEATWMYFKYKQKQGHATDPPLNTHIAY